MFSEADSSKILSRVFDWQYIYVWWTCFSTDSGHPYGYRCSSCRLTIYLCVVGVFFNRQSTSIWVPMLLLSPDNIFMCGGRVFSTDSRHPYHGYQCSSCRLTIYLCVVDVFFQQTVDIPMDTNAPLIAWQYISLKNLVWLGGDVDHTYPFEIYVTDTTDTARYDWYIDLHL